MLVPLLVVSCNSGSDDAQKGAVKTGKKDPQAAKDEMDECADALDGAYHVLHPSRLHVSTYLKTAIGMLNGWANSCDLVDLDKAALTDEQSAALSKLLTKEELERVAGLKYPLRDGYHVHNAILFRGICDANAVANSTDLEKVVRLFEFVVQNVELVNVDYPMPPLRSLLVSRASAAHRAWLFANLLRELRIDGVILRPKSKESAADAWLSAVLLDGNVLLFDMRLGLPIPSPDEDASSIRTQRPATLKEVLDDPKILEDLSVDSARPYAIKAEDLKQVKVQVIGNSSYWSPRMRVLQTQLSGTRGVIVYDGLLDEDSQPGLISRVVQAGGASWSRDDVSVWPIPEREFVMRETLKNIEELSPQQQGMVSHWLEAKIALDAPRPVIAINEETQEIVHGRPQQKLQKARIRHLMGRHAAAITSYMNARTWPTMPPVELEKMPADEGWITESQFPTNELSVQIAGSLQREVMELHSRAADSAILWIGDCQVSQDALADAVKTYRLLLERSEFGFVIVVNRENRVEALTGPKLQEVFSGTTGNWADLGGETKATRVYRPADLSGAAGRVFAQFILQGRPFGGNVVPRPTSENVIHAVTLDRGAIGVIHLGDWRFGDERVKVLGVHTPDSKGIETVTKTGPTTGYPFSIKLELADTARYRLAVTLAASGELAEAVDVLGRMPPSYLQYDGCRLLVRRWKRIFESYEK